MPRGTTAISPGPGVEHAELGAEPQPPLLRHDQQLAVGVDEDAVGHRLVAR